MTDNILIGEGAGFREASESVWRSEIEAALATPDERLAFMTPEHHLVRDTAVTEIARRGAPLPPAAIAESTGLDVARVEAILAELEPRLFFVSRNESGEVSWAYPVTATRTPHRLELSTGEWVYAA